MKKLLILLLAGVSALSVCKSVAQTTLPAPPFNVDLGALITDTANATATVNGTQQSNLDRIGVICLYNVTVSVGGPTISYNVQGYDTAANVYYTIATSGNISSAATNPAALMVKPGAITGDAPAQMTVKGLALPRLWRVTRTRTGGTNVTGTLGCNLIK